MATKYKYALNLDPETNRILSATFAKYYAPGMVKVVNLPDGDISEYLYIDGEYVHDPLTAEEGENNVEVSN